MTIENEATRLAIMARIPATAWSNPDRAACEAKSGEMLKSVFHSDNQGVLVFEQKYGERPGYRTVVLSAPDAASDLRLVTNVFADVAKNAPTLARIESRRKVNVLEVAKAPAANDRGEMLPSDATSAVMSYTFHVRSLGDHRVICSTSSLDDAKRIVAALGNCAVFQFRDSRSYDDTTIWAIGLVVAVAS